MSVETERIALRTVGLLVLVGISSAFVLWTIDTSVSSGESLFAVYLSIDLIAFTMITYIYRVTKVGATPGRIPLIAGCVLLILLVAAGFAI